MGPRVVTIRQKGGIQMLLQWLRRREVYRAYAKPSQRLMVIFKPFVSKPYRTVPRRTSLGHIEADPAKFMEALLEGSDDDFDLFAHEVGWHIVEDKHDAPGVNGIGSNDLLRRARTTTPADRMRYVELIARNVDVLRFEGF